MNPHISAPMMFFLSSHFGLYIIIYYYTACVQCKRACRYIKYNIILQPLVFCSFDSIADVVYFSRLQNNFVFVVEPAEYNIISWWAAQYKRLLLLLYINFTIKLYIRPTSYGISCFFKTNYLRPIIIIMIIFYTASTRYSVQCVGIIHIIPNILYIRIYYIIIICTHVASNKYDYSFRCGTKTTPYCARNWI